MLSQASEVEQTIAKKLVDAALAKGYVISVYDGEETPLQKSCDRPAILEAMATTDHDLLIMRRPDGSHVGNVLLIYGNGEDLISDSTCGEDIEALLKEVDRGDP